MLFVFDIDGTLMIHEEDKSYIPDSVKQAFDLIREYGHQAIFATGRSLFEAEQLMREFSVTDCVLSDGAVIVCDHTVIIEKFIDPVIVNDVITKSKQDQLAILGCNSESRYLLHSSKLDKHIAMVNAYAKATSIDDDFKKLEVGINYSALSCFEPYPYEINGEADVTVWPVGISIAPKGVNKASGILEYIKHKNISHSDVFVFGDNYNDIAMFDRFYEHSYVANDADDEVKSHAKYVLDDLQADGIYNAILDVVKR